MGFDRRRVVVAVDATPTSEGALRWAAARAADLATGLTLVYVYEPGAQATSEEADRDLAADFDIRSRQLTMMRDRMASTHPGLDIDSTILAGEPAELMTRVSRLTDCLVLGARGLGMLRSMLLRGTSDAVVTHGHGVVVVVNEGAVVDRAGPVLVGVDPGHESSRVVALARDEARRLGTGLRVCVISPLPELGHRAYGPVATQPGLLDDHAEQIARRALAGVIDDESVPVEIVGLPGDAASQLVVMSTEAAAVVVGSRGRGRAAGLFGGSVSRRVAQEARCPVLVVRPDVEDADQDPDDLLDGQ